MRVNIRIYGQVQGVFFRSSAKAEAEKLGLVGWVKNNLDGSVEAVAQGNKDDLENFLNWCKRGPAFAKVEKIEVSWEKASEAFDDFSIV